MLLNSRYSNRAGENLQLLNPDIRDGLRAIEELSERAEQQAYFFLRLQRNSRGRWAQLERVLARVRDDARGGIPPGYDYSTLIPAFETVANGYARAVTALGRWLSGQSQEFKMLVLRLETETGTPSRPSSQQSRQSRSPQPQAGPSRPRYPPPPPDDDDLYGPG